jgi:D-alanyl-D-alanine endopeptidase (penicillin-binding protein 7)
MNMRRARSLLFRLVAAASVLFVSAPGFVAESAGATLARTRQKSVTSSTSAKSTAKAKPASKKSSVARTSRSKSKSAYSASRSRARRARLARALALQRQREAREAMVPRFKLDEGGALVPDIRAAAAVVYNPATQEVLWEENGAETRSIASITKVMTAVVFLEHETDLSRTVHVEPSDVVGARHTYLRRNERLRLEDALNLMLVASDNAAARLLARVSPFGRDGFIEQMNEKARELGLTQTHYADPSGLLQENLSSARDMARLIAYAASDERIASVMRKTDHFLTTSRRSFSVHTTNRLVGSDIDVLGGKTGFIRSSGYCLATLLRLPQSNEEVAVVVLGARSNAGRFWETRHLFNWISSNAQGLFAPVPPTQPATEIPQEQP